jgi:uncharacterized protein
MGPMYPDYDWPVASRAMQKGPGWLPQTPLCGSGLRTRGAGLRSEAEVGERALAVQVEDEPRHLAPAEVEEARSGGSQAGLTTALKAIGRCRIARVEQRVTLVTLGVSDYARSKAFYEALGWSAALDIEETAFFQTNGIVLTLWARDKLAADTGISDDGARWGGIVLAHNVRSREEVEEVIEHARTNGAEITREPSETFYGGYAGVFLDLDGHPWEVAHNPGFDLDDEGNIILPDT